MTFKRYTDALEAHADWADAMRRFPSISTGEGWIEDRLAKYGEAAAAPSAVAFHHSVEDTLNATTLYVTEPMHELVLAAMDSFRIEEPVAGPDVFVPHGFLVMPKMLATPDFHGKITGQRVIMWRYVDPLLVWMDDERRSLTFDLNADGWSEAGVRFMLLAWHEDEDDYQMPPEFHELVRRGLRWGVTHATSIPLSMMSNRAELSGEGDPSAGWLVYWRVLQRLMSQRITASVRENPGRGLRRQAERAGIDDPSSVLVINLRRPQSHRGESEGNGSGRTYTHQWVVGEHWRNQWYPSVGEHRQILIPSYVKGPEDAPLIVKRRLYRFSR